MGIGGFFIFTFNQTRTSDSHLFFYFLFSKINLCL